MTRKIPELPEKRKETQEDMNILAQYLVFKIFDKTADLHRKINIKD